MRRSGISPSINRAQHTALDDSVDTLVIATVVDMFQIACEPWACCHYQHQQPPTGASRGLLHRQHVRVESITIISKEGN